MDSQSIHGGAIETTLDGRSYTSYRSAMTSLSETIHPLSPAMSLTPVESDPLFSPPSPSSLGEFRISDASESSFSGDLGIHIHRTDYDKLIIAPKSQSPGDQYMDISVSDPQKEQEMPASAFPGGGTYITYLITTRTNIREFKGSCFCVRRRFKDVVALSDRLSESYRGFIIPPRPDKNMVESQVIQKQEFVEQRRNALEKYLRNLASHQVIRLSVEFKMFLQVQGKLPFQPNTNITSRMPDDAIRFSKKILWRSGSLPSPNNGYMGIFKIFKGLNQSMAPVVEEDDGLTMKNKLLDFEENLSNISKQAESLVNAQKSIGEAMGDMGLAFMKLTKFENENAVYSSGGVHASQLKEVGIASIKTSRLYRSLNSQTVKHLETVHEYLGLMLAVDDAFSHRSYALATLQTITSELHSLRKKMENLELASSNSLESERTKSQKIEELKSALRVSENDRNSASQEYEQIKENNKNEVERLRRQKQVDFLNMLKGLVATQMGFAEKTKSIWTKIAADTSHFE